MSQPTPLQVVDAVQSFIYDFLDNPPEGLIYDYHPQMRCYDAAPVASSVNGAGWTVRVCNAFPEDDGLRLRIAEHLFDKFSINVDVALEWR